MLKKSDLPRIKLLARTFLMLEQETMEAFPFLVKHPFTDSSFVCVNSADGVPQAIDITRNKNALQEWRESISASIDKAETSKHIFMMFTKPYSFAFLNHAMPCLSKTDFSECLADTWVICEAPNSDPSFTKKQLVGLFKKADPQSLMTTEEYEQLQSIDDTVTVYRGVTEYNADQVKALSWTLDKEKAEWFAHRFGEDGTVYQAQIGKEHILAFLAAETNPRSSLIPLG